MEANLFNTIQQNDTKDIDTYLLQINSIKLQDYVNIGLIAPDKYLKEEREIDIQSKNINFLVVSEGYFEDLDTNQILLELIFTEKEKQFHHSGDGYFFDIPLPISRIKKIYAKDKNTIKQICVHIENSENGLLPEDLFDVFIVKNELKFEKKEYVTLDGTIQSKDYTDKIRHFDKRMGMFAFVRNTTIYYANKNESISNYSEHYFNILSFLIKIKDENYPKYDALDILNKDEKFKKLVYSDTQISKEFLVQTLDLITDPNLKEIFSQLLQPNSTRKTLPLLFKEENKIYYLIGLIYYFRQKDANKKDNFKTDITTLIPYEIAELALATLGIYLGYKSLRSKEVFNLNDKFFTKIFGNTFDMKFRLNSKLDYITIESIYNFSFYENTKDYFKADGFEYLTYPTQSKASTFPKSKEFQELYDVKQKSIYDTEWIEVSKKPIEEVVLKKLENYPEDVLVYGKDHIVSFFLKYFPKENQQFTSITSISCKKSDFLEVVKNNASSKQQKELFLLFTADEQ